MSFPNFSQFSTDCIFLVRVMHGNVLFERSVLVHGRNAPREEWQPFLDAAVTSWTLAGCSAADIAQALAGHSGAAGEAAAAAATTAV